VYEGCINEDDRRIDDGVAALMEAAGGPEPHSEAVLDLSWVMALRGLPAMAMLYAKQAAELMPDRRDAWAFYGRACADRGQLEEACRAMEHACAQPDATARDHQLLATLREGTLPQTSGNVMSFFTPELEELHHQVVGQDESLNHQFHNYMYKSVRLVQLKQFYHSLYHK